MYREDDQLTSHLAIYIQHTGMRTHHRSASDTHLPLISILLPDIFNLMLAILFTMHWLMLHPCVVHLVSVLYLWESLLYVCVCTS